MSPSDKERKWHNGMVGNKDRRQMISQGVDIKSSCERRDAMRYDDIERE